MGVTEDFIAGLKAKKAAQVGTALSLDASSPEDAAENLSLSNDLGLPANVIAADPAGFKRQSTQRKNSELLVTSPLTREWLSDMQNAAIAKDDVGNLAWFESVARESKEFDQRFAAGASGMAESVIRARRQKEKSLQAGIEDAAPDFVLEAERQMSRYRFILERGIGDDQKSPMSESERNLYQSRLDAATMAVENWSAVRDDGAWMVGDRASRADDLAGSLRQWTKDTFGEAPEDDSLWADLSYGIGSFAVFVLPSLLPGGVAVTAQLGSDAARMEAFDRATEQGATEDQANAAASIAGLLGTTEAIPISRALSRLPRPVRNGILGVLGKFAVDYAKGAVEEGVQEGMMAIGQNLIEKFTYNPAQDIITDDVGRQSLVGAILGGFLGGGASLIREGRRAASDSRFDRDMARANAAGTTAAAIDQIDKMAAASKLKQRAPDKFGEVLRAQGGGDFYVPAAEMREYFQSNDIAIEDVLSEYGIDLELFNEQASAGQDIAVPTSVYAEKISGTDNAEWFAANAVTDPDEMSMADAQRFNDEVQGVLEEALEEAEQSRLNDEAVRASDVQIYDETYSQLRAAGRSPDVAQNEAHVMAAFWRTMAERSGKDVLDLARSMGLRIQGPQQAETRRRGDLDARLNELRANLDRALKPRGDSLLDFVRDNGGVSDVGGDVAKMDPPKGVIGEIREQVQDRAGQPTLGSDLGPTENKARGLDDMGRMAIEAGFFPEYMGGADIQADGTVVDEAAVMLEALGEALRGNDRYRQGDGPDETMQALANALSERGIDLSEVSNDEAVAAMGGELFQQAAPEGSDAFEAWFGDSKVVDTDGSPLVVYHGTASDFEAFDKRSLGKATGATSSKAGFFFATKGRTADGYAYFAATNAPVQKLVDDSTNAEKRGDWDTAHNKIVEAENLESEMAEPGGDQRGQTVMPVYLSIQNPLEYDAKGEVPDGLPDGINGLIDEARRGGRDGVIIRNFDDAAGFSNVEADHFIAFEPTQIKSVNNRGTFDPADPRILYQGQENPRGSIQFPVAGLQSGETVINLLESADLSTFLHESSHFFLEAFASLADSGASPQQMRDDMATIRKWLGNDGSAFTTEQSEQWARGGEAYFMEGKAPSLDLADAFSRFKAWLTRIYKTALGLNVKISPAIREVMDRMLATDAEIAETRAEQEMQPLFTTAPAGMSDTVWRTYQRMTQRGADEAERRLLNKTMAKVRREKEAWFRQEKAAVREKAEKEINQQPVYRLTEMLANQKWFGSTEEVQDMRINRKDLVGMFGEGIIAELSRTKLGGKRAIYAKDGASPSEIAEHFGFDGPVQMVEALQNAGKRKDAISAETDRRMVERYGDPLHDGSIESEALAAIHNEQQANASVSEARHMAKRLGRDLRGMKTKIYRQRARLMVGRMSVREASRPATFLAAERKAARAAENAFAKVTRGNSDALATALQAKEQQILNGFIYNEARKVESEVQKGRERMRKYSKATVRKKLEGGYIEQIDAILEDYDFRVRSGPQIQRAENLRDFMDRMIKEGRGDDLAIDERLTDEAKRKHYTKLSVDELRGLFDTVANLDHIGRFKQKLVDAQTKRELGKVAGDFAVAVANHFGDGHAGNQSKAVRNFFNLWFTVDTMLVDIDGEEMGVSYDGFKTPIDAGQALEQQMNVKMATDVEKIFSVYSAKELTNMQVGQKIDGGNGFAWSRMEIISLALNVGTESNRTRVLEKTAHPSRRLTEDQMNATLATLDKRDWDFVQSMWKQVGSYWPDLAIVHKRRTGVDLKKLNAIPVETPFGTIEGGYYHASYDADRSIGAARDESSTWDKFLASNRGAAKVKSGMTIERQVTSGGRTLNFDLSVSLTHMRDTIRVITMSEAIDNAGRILKHRAVELAFMNAGQKDMHQTLDLFLGDLAEGPVYNTDPINSAARIIKNNFTMAKLAFNFKTVLLQMTGIAQSAAIVGKRNMLRGYRDYLANPAAGVEMAVSKSALMSERQTSFQKDIYDQVNDVKVSSPLAKRSNKAKNVVSKAGFWALIKTQFLTVDVPTWIAAHDAEMKRNGDEGRAIRYADRMVVRAQGSGLYGDRNSMERGTISRNVRQSDFIRMWTTLTSYMVTKMNRGYLAVQKGRRGVSEAESTGQALGSVVNMSADLALLYMAEGIMIGLTHYALAGDDADEDDLLEFVMKESAVTVVSGVPIVSGIANAFQGYGSGGVLASVLEMPANFYIQALQGENDKAFRRSVIDGIGMLTGLPSTATTRIIEQFINASQGNEVSPAEALLGTNPLTR